VTLAARLLLLVALALLPPLAIQAWNGLEQRREREAALRAEAVAQTRALQGDVARLAEGIRQLLVAIAEVPAVRAGDAAGCTAYLQAVARQHPAYSLLAVNDAQGLILCSSAGAAPGEYSNAARAYHRHAMASGGFAAGDLVMGVATRRPSIHFALPFRRVDGEAGGVVLASVDQAWLSGQLAADALPQGAEALVLDPSGTVAAAALDNRPAVDGWVGRPAPEALRAAMHVREAAAFEAIGPDGAERLFGAVPSSPILGGIVVAVGLDRTRMLAELRQATKRNLLALALGAVLAMSTGLLGGRRFVLAPLARLAAAADRVGGGDLGSRADLGRRSGEMREVGKAFNRMSAALATREGERASAEAARQAGEARLARLLATTPAGVVELDAEGCFTYANAAAEQILGAEPGGLVGRRYDDPAWDITAQDGSPIPPDHLPAAWTLRGEAARDYEHTLRTLDGRRAMLLVDAVPVRDGQGRIEGALAAFQDVTARHAQAQALGESKGRLDAALAVARLGTFEWDLKTDAVTLDGRSREIFGFAPGEGARAQEVFDRIDPTDLNRVAAEAEASKQALSRLETEYRIHLPDGSVRTVLSISDAVPGTDGAAERLAGVFSDVTDRTRTEAALRDERNRLEVLNRTGAQLAAELDPDRLVQAVTDAGVELTGARLGAFLCDMQNEEGGTDTLYALSGVDRSALGGVSMPRAADVFVPVFGGERVLRSDDIAADPRFRQTELHQVVPDGGSPMRSCLAAPVVSRGGEVLGGLLFGHPEAGAFTEAAERVVAGLAGQAASAIDNARLFRAAQRAKETLEARVEARTQDLRQAIATLHEEVLERERTEDALRQSQKMEAVGQLTGGIAHDFNNMLQGIGGALETVQRRVAQGRTAELGPLMEAARQGVTRAAALTHRLLAFARRQALDPRPVEPDALIKGMEELIRRTVGPGIKVELGLRDGVWSVLCDPNQLENALLNLAINARDAMADGGKLTLATKDLRLSASDVAGQDGITPGDYVEISVADTGTGMDEATRARAFEPFFTTKPIGHGTGLGLSQLYGFVRQSGGLVRLDSAPGRGTAVRLYLPRHHRGEAAPDAEPDLEEAVAGGSGTVLLVEDEDGVRAVAAERLRELGYEVLEAGDGPAALRLLRPGRRVDLLVSDVGLPGGMNGRQVADTARERRPGLPVLFITGYAGSAFDGRLAPGMEVITKPFALEALAARVQAMLEAALVR